MHVLHKESVQNACVKLAMPDEVELLESFRERFFLSVRAAERASGLQEKVLTTGSYCQPQIHPPKLAWNLKRSPFQVPCLFGRV